ncbi:ATP-binding protein [Fervidobacterium thailandense]|uniref:ATP-binding protein n=1 Tax=Fervidobacterium thailandense TaxID=1008305 RepID=A0A1E3G2X3_9BACT|nr:ATP-binding protein [Fervidobacterium thailandense]
MIFASWSGGKDSALAFYFASQKFGKVDHIFTMFSEDCGRTRAHGLKLEHIRAQAESLGAELIFACASWQSYEDVFSIVISSNFAGGLGVFGDIDIQEHLDWVVRVCTSNNVGVFEPLWGMDREEVLERFIRLGFRAKVVRVKKGYEELLGRELDEDFIELAKKLNIDLCGEHGEYHTFVYDGPIFKFPIPTEDLEYGIQD